MSLNPLLGKVKLPGRVFQLPSKAIFYAPGVLADTVKDGEIQVKPMSALTELKIRSADLLISTKILGEVCSECAPEILQPGKLLSKDVDALFTFLVVSTYGTDKKIRAHHDCKEGKWEDYTVNLEPILSNPRNESLNHRDVLFSCDLPNGQVVKLKPVTFDDAIELLNMRAELTRRESQQNPPSMQEIEKVMLADLLATIQSVEDGTGEEKVSVVNRDHIREWLRILPRKFIDIIVGTANSSGDWGFDFATTLKCPACKSDFKYDLELNPINFFNG
jgi:hypothetical protein